MSKTPMLDKIAAEECLEDSGQIPRALKELAARHDAKISRTWGLRPRLCCTQTGWAIHYGGSYSEPGEIISIGAVGFNTAEDAIHALRVKVDDWIVQAEGEDAEPCTDAARKAGCTCTVPFAHSTSIDPPEPRVDRDCPLHGRRDPDAAREQLRDDRRRP